MKIKYFFNCLLFALGRYDCKEGNKAKFSFNSYIYGYDYQYKIEIEKELIINEK